MEKKIAVIRGDGIGPEIVGEAIAVLETVAEKFKKYDLTAMPVVDGENRLVGMVTVDEVLKLAEGDGSGRVQR